MFFYLADLLLLINLITIHSSLLENIQSVPKLEESILTAYYTGENKVYRSYRHISKKLLKGDIAI